MRNEMRFSKTDGALNYYDSSIRDASNTILSYVRITRSGYNPGILGGSMDPMLLIAIGAGAAVLIVVVIVIIKRK